MLRVPICGQRVFIILKYCSSRLGLLLACGWTQELQPSPIHHQGLVDGDAGAMLPTRLREAYSSLVLNMKLYKPYLRQTPLRSSGVGCCDLSEAGNSIPENNNPSRHSAPISIPRNATVATLADLLRHGEHSEWAPTDARAEHCLHRSPGSGEVCRGSDKHLGSGEKVVGVAQRRLRKPNPDLIILIRSEPSPPIPSLHLWCEQSEGPHLSERRAPASAAERLRRRPTPRAVGAAQWGGSRMRLCSIPVIHTCPFNLNRVCYPIG